MKYLVIISTYNESQNIESLVKRILIVDDAIEVLVVDDSSPDLTRELVLRFTILQPRVHLIKRNKRMGFGSAYYEGFQYAIKNNFDYIFQMDGDGSHSPENLKIF